MAMIMFSYSKAIFSNSRNILFNTNLMLTIDLSSKNKTVHLPADLLPYSF